MVYLFDANDANGYTQSALLAAAQAGTLDLGKAIDSATLSAGVLSKQSLTSVADQQYKLFVVAVDGDNTFISAAIDQAGPGSAEGDTTASFTLKAPSQAAFVKRKEIWYNRRYGKLAGHSLQGGGRTFYGRNPCVPWVCNLGVYARGSGCKTSRGGSALF